MSMPSCQEVVGNYLDQLRNDFECSPSAEGWFLSTPFVRPDGEGIEIELRALSNGLIRLTDMGDTFGYLYVNGLTLSQKVVADTRQMAKPHGVSLQRSQLVTQVPPESLGAGVQDLIQTVLAVTDLIQKRRPTSGVRFDDEVESFIIHKGVQYDVGFRVAGIRETHTIKFHVNSGRGLLIHPVSAAQEGPARNWAERLYYRFADILGQNPSWRPVVVLDDRGNRSQVWTTNARTPIREHSVLWSAKSELESIFDGWYSEANSRG